MKTKTSKSTSARRGFRPSSFRAKALTFLSDGKPRTAEEIVKGVGGTGNINKRTPYQFVYPIIVDLETAGYKVLRDREKGTFALSKEVRKAA